MLCFTVWEEDQQNFKFIVYLFLHGCGLHYNVLSGLSVKQEVKGLMTNYITMHYPGIKPVYLQLHVFEFIGATVSEFHVFMRLRM